MSILNFSELFRRITRVYPVSAARVVVLWFGVMALAACSPWTGPAASGTVTTGTVTTGTVTTGTVTTGTVTTGTVTTGTVTTGTPAPGAVASGTAACPTAQARYLSCSNGVKMMTYEAAFDLVGFCEPLQKIESKIRGFDRNQPMHSLASGERAMLLGPSGWLLLPREPDITDAPGSMAAWWNNRACTMPSALRAF